MRLGRVVGGVLVTAAAACVVFVVPAAAGARQSAPDDAARSIPYFITSGDSDTGFRASDRELAAWAFDAWTRNADGALRFDPAPLIEQAMVRVYWAPATGTQYGETRPIFVGRRRGAAVFVRPDVSALGPDIASRAAQDPLWRDTVVYLTCLHEIGHAFGLDHTADTRDIMYFFGYGGDIVEFFARYRRQIKTRADIRTVSGLSAADISRVRGAK